MSTSQPPTRQVSLTSRLKIALLAVGLLPALFVAGVILFTTQGALRSTAEQRVATARDGRAESLHTYVETVQGQITTFAQARDTVEALKDLPKAFEEMGAEAGVDAGSYSQIEASVSDYYRGPFSEQYLAANGADAEAPVINLASLERPAIIAQYAYIAGNKYPLGSKDDLADAGNGTTYDRLHAEIHPGIRSFLKTFGYYDIFFIDAESGRIVYSVFKEIDYGTSLIDGPHASTNLGEAYRQALALGSPSKHAITGYEVYAPSYDAPASFIAAPVYDGRDLLGVVAFQLPLDRVSAAVGQVRGLGETGDAYLVGPDGRLWSDSLRNEDFTVVASFQSDKTVSNGAVTAALNGEAGTVTGLSLSGEKSIVSYSPVKFAGSNVALLTLQTEDEAMAAARRGLYLSCGMVVLAAVVITLLAVRLNRGVARNVTSMVDTIVRQSGDVASGTLLSRSDPSSTPYAEFAPVLASINQMADAFTGQMDAIPVPIVVHDRDLKAQFVNAAAARLAHRDASALLGSTYYEATGPEDWRNPSFSTRQTLSLGSASETVGQWKTPGGERDVRSVQTPIKVEGEVVGALETLLDETEVRTSERRQQKVADYSSRAVERLTVAFEHVTHGDLTIEFVPEEAADEDVVAAADEFSRVATGFANTMSAFRETIATTRANAERTGQAVSELTTLAATLLDGNETTADRASTVTAATEEMSMNVDSVASAAEEMSINIGSVSESASEMSTKMRMAAGAIEKLSRSIGDVASAATEGTSVASDAATKSSQANEAMETLGHAATEIDKVTEVIKRIAEKTNLLALNATIEAASAGEAGKGFAVVAHEVKELAHQCSTAAEDITERIAGVQRNTSEAVQVIGAMSDIIGELARVSDGIAAKASEQDRSVQEISTTVATVDRGVEQTASAIAEIVQGANDVSRSAGELTQGASEVASSIGEVNELARGGGTAAQRVGNAAKSLSDVVEQLNAGVERFKIDAHGTSPGQRLKAA